MNVKNNSQTLLTFEQAYRAMFDFLQLNWERGKSEELAMLLGSMDLLPDGRPADPALWADWKKICEQAQTGQKHEIRGQV